MFIALGFIFLLDLCDNEPGIHSIGQTSVINIRHLACSLEVAHPNYVKTKLDEEKNDHRSEAHHE